MGVYPRRQPGRFLWNAAGCGCAAQAGDQEALEQLSGGRQSYLREAAGYYGTSTPTYRALFDAAQADAGSLVDDLNAKILDTFGDSAEQFAAMNQSLDSVVSLMKELPDRLLPGFEAAIGKASRDIVDALLRQGIDIRNHILNGNEAATRA